MSIHPYRAGVNPAPTFSSRVVIPEFRRSRDIRNPGERNDLLDTGSRPPQADSSGMTCVNFPHSFRPPANSSDYYQIRNPKSEIHNVLSSVL